MVELPLASTNVNDDEPPHVSLLVTDDSVVGPPFGCRPPHPNVMTRRLPVVGQSTVFPVAPDVLTLDSCVTLATWMVEGGVAPPALLTFSATAARLKQSPAAVSPVAVNVGSTDACVAWVHH